jgi:ferredoxin
VTFLDRHNRLKVRIDRTKCTGCGSCLEVCHRGARYYLDDTEAFFNDLKAGRSISVMVSRTIQANLPDYKKVIGQLKKSGVKKIFSISLGMELFIWAHVRYLKKYKPVTLLSSLCPVVVTFCQNHRPELLPRLSPIINPTAIMAIIIKNILGIDDNLGVISSCLANNPAVNSELNILEYNISFSKLREYLTKNQNDFFDCPEADFDLLEPLEDPLVKINCEFYDLIRYLVGPELRTDNFSGTNNFNVLDEYAAAPPEALPKLLALMGCEGGCVMGPGRVEEVKHFSVNAYRYRSWKSIFRSHPREILLARHEIFDHQLDLQTFIREHHQSQVTPDYVSEERIKDAFLILNKKTTAQKTVDCFACGSPTCLEMAKKIALGVNIPENCVLLAHQMVTRSNKKITDYLMLVRLIGEYMLASGTEDIISTIEHSLMALCSALDISRASIWRNTYDANELPECELFISFPARTHFSKNVMTTESMPGWLETLSDGVVINKSYAELNNRERSFFTGRDISVMCIIPIMAQGEFWGNIMMARRHNQFFTKEEISVIESSAFLIISSLISATNEFHGLGSTSIPNLG